MILLISNCGSKMRRNASRMCPHIRSTWVDGVENGSVRWVRQMGRKWVENASVRGVENGLLLLLEMVFKGFLGDNVISV